MPVIPLDNGADMKHLENRHGLARKQFEEETAQILTCPSLNFMGLTSQKKSNGTVMVQYKP